MNIITVTTLYPNEKEPKLGIFIKTRLAFLRRHYPDVKLKVIAPVPWFPFESKTFGEYAKYAGVKDKEIIDGVEVYHPKYLVIPKVGMYLTPHFLAKAMKKGLLQLLQQGEKIDVIDGHYYYPDGVALERVASELDIPFTCTARGTDINLIPQYPKARAMIQKVFNSAAHNMAVCQALSDEMIAMGADPEKVTTLRNGVDLDLFQASDEQQQAELKSELALAGKLILSVGWLIERKGHYLIIEALQQIPDAKLLIAGDGPDLLSLQKLAQQCSVADRVVFLGSLNQQELNKYYRTADVTVLASSREGWANVLLESMSSGTPVVATRVWGTPEVVQTSDVGQLVDRSVNGIAQGINQVLGQNPSRLDVRAYAERFDWKATSAGQYQIFERIIK